MFVHIVKSSFSCLQSIKRKAILPGVVSNTFNGSIWEWVGRGRKISFVFENSLHSKFQASRGYMVRSYHHAKKPFPYKTKQLSQLCFKKCSLGLERWIRVKFPFRSRGPNALF